jgi:hypothetical protein
VNVSHNDMSGIRSYERNELPLLPKCGLGSMIHKIFIGAVHEGYRMQS